MEAVWRTKFGPWWEADCLLDLIHYSNLQEKNIVAFGLWNPHLSKLLPWVNKGPVKILGLPDPTWEIPGDFGCGAWRLLEWYLTRIWHHFCHILWCNVLWCHFQAKGQVISLLKQHLMKSLPAHGFKPRPFLWCYFQSPFLYTKTHTLLNKHTEHTKLKYELLTFVLKVIYLFWIYLYQVKGREGGNVGRQASSARIEEGISLFKFFLQT